MQVLPELKSGGVEKTTLEIVKAIAMAGGRSLVASAGGAMVSQVSERGGEHFTLPLHSRNPITIWRNVALLKKLMLDEGIDIVHVRSRAPAWSVYYAARALNIPMLTTYHAPYNNNFWGKHLYNSVMARGRLVIAISEFIKKHIISEYGNEAWFDEKAIRLVCEGIDTDRFDPDHISDKDVDALKKQWKIKASELVIVLPGRLTRWKGQAVMLRAMALIKTPDIKCIIVGGDQGRAEYREELTSLSKELGLEKKVSFIDHTDQMPTAFKMADLMISTSTDPEGFGLVMAEAQAMQTSVIATKHGAALEVVQDGITGFLVEPNNPEHLAHAIDAFFDMPEKELENMKKAARKHVIASFSLENMRAKTIAVYGEILG